MNSNNYTQIFVLAVALFTSFCISACATRTFNVEYHNITADTNPSHRQTVPSVTLLIGPVRVSSFLNMGPLVKQKSLHSATLLEQHQWAGNLDEMLLQILTQNLILDLGSEKINPYPDNSSVTGIRLSINFFHFEEDEAGNALLQARWQLINNADQSVLYSHTSTETTTPENSDYDAMAKALSHNLAELCREIAAKVTEMQHTLQPTDETKK